MVILKKSIYFKVLENNLKNQNSRSQDPRKKANSLTLPQHSTLCISPQSICQFFGLIWEPENPRKGWHLRGREARWAFSNILELRGKNSSLGLPMHPRLRVVLSSEGRDKQRSELTVGGFFPIKVSDDWKKGLKSKLIPSKNQGRVCSSLLV